MPVKDVEDGVGGVDTPSGAEITTEPNRFHVDLPQFVETELRRHKVVPLAPVRDKVPFAPRTLRERERAAATSWRVKGVLQKVLGALPFGGAMHQQLPRRSAGSGTSRASATRRSTTGGS